MVEKPEISPIYGKSPAHAEIRVHNVCFLDEQFILMEE